MEYFKYANFGVNSDGFGDDGGLAIENGEAERDGLPFRVGVSDEFIEELRVGGDVSCAEAAKKFQEMGEFEIDPTAVPVRAVTFRRFYPERGSEEWANDSSSDYSVRGQRVECFIRAWKDGGYTGWVEPKSGKVAILHTVRGVGCGRTGSVHVDNSLGKGEWEFKWLNHTYLDSYPEAEGRETMSLDEIEDIRQSVSRELLGR